MDLQAILDASDDDDDDSVYNGSYNHNGGGGGGMEISGSNIDLEDILREDEDEEDDDDDDYYLGTTNNWKLDTKLSSPTYGSNQWEATTTPTSVSTAEIIKGSMFAQNPPAARSSTAGSSPNRTTTSTTNKYDMTVSSNSTAINSHQHHQHNADDWAVLQHILNNDEDDDSDSDQEDWMGMAKFQSKYQQNQPHRGPNKKGDDAAATASSSSAAVDNLVVDDNSSSSTDDEQVENNNSSSNNFLAARRKFQGDVLQKPAISPPSRGRMDNSYTIPVVVTEKQKNSRKADGQPETTNGHAVAALLDRTPSEEIFDQQQQQQYKPPSLSSDLLATAATEGKRPNKRGGRQSLVPPPPKSMMSEWDDHEEWTKKDTTRQDEDIYSRSLSNAQSSERKLLKSGRREIVSPLMVKRRLKPKIELLPRNYHTNNRKTTTAAATGGGGSSTSRMMKNNRPSSHFGFSGVVENKSMSGISASLVKHADQDTAKVMCGLPTCLSFNSKFIAVGTQLGIILIFDLFEVLRQRLGSNKDDSNYHVDTESAGSIHSIDLSHNGDAVVAGYTSGILVLWDTIRGYVLRTVHDAHPSPITSVRFLNELKMVTVDAGGLVNKLVFSRNIIWSNYSVDTECLLDGTAGQILAMNVLSPFSTIKPLVRPDAYAKVFRNLTLIALSSERSSFVVAVEPKINVLHRWAKPPVDRMRPLAEASTDVPETQVYLPCLAWGWALIAGGGNVVMPVLARGWGCCLQLLVSSFPTLDDEAPIRIGEEPVVHWPAFGVHKEFDASTPVVALEWLNDRSLVYLTASNEFTLVDSVMMTMLERLDFTGFKLVYAEFSLSRSAAKGGSDGASIPTTCITFQNSIRCSDDRIMVLCQDELKRISIVGARRRISALEADGEWLEALAFALDHYENTVISQEDRRRDPEGKRDLSRHPEFSAAKSDDEEWIAKLLIRYLNLAVENAPEASPELNTSYTKRSSSSTRIDLAQSHFQMLAGVCVEFCVVTRRLDLLFGPIFRRFQNVGFLSVFLDVLEPYVLNDKLSYLAPEAMSYFVEHCKATNGISTVERCLLHMDVTIMDFDSILTLLRSNEMYSALFYVFNQGLDDYVTPLEILLEKVFNEADSGGVSIVRRSDGALQNGFERLGYKAILYLQSCFRGKTFPKEGVLEPEERARTLKVDLLKFLLQENFSPSPHVKKAVNLLPSVGHRAQRFPYLRLLLLVDPRGMLDTLSLVLDSEDNFLLRSRSASESADGWVDGGGGRLNQNTHVPDIQEIMIDLSSILLPKSPSLQIPTEASVFRSRGAVNAFLDFAARYIIDGQVRVEKSVTLRIFARISRQYATSKSSDDRHGYQRQAMDVLSALPSDAYDPDKVLEVFNHSNMHRAALLLHQQVASSWIEAGFDDMELRSRHFLSAIDCFIEDEDVQFRMEVFNYVKKECSGVYSSNAEDDGHPKTLRESAFDRLQALVRLDALMTARLVGDLFAEDLDRVIGALDSEDGESQFLFLQAVESGALAEADPVAGSVLNLTMEHHHRYLELMAKLHPDMVYDYLATHDNYRTEECLRLCEAHDIADASAYLLERMGNVSSALQLILQTLETRMMNLKRTIRGIGVDVIRQQSGRSSFHGRQSTPKLVLPSKQERDVDGVRRILTVALDVCERNSGPFATRKEQGSKFSHGELWFNVLDRLINAKGFLRLTKEQPEHAKVMAGVLSELLRQTMQRMVSSVPLTDLVRKVTSDHSGSRIGELREMVEGLLATYGFELKVFKGAVRAFHDDVGTMRRGQMALQLEGSSIQSVMNTSLEDSLTGRKLSEHPQYRDGVLSLAGKGNAVFAESNGFSYSQKTERGLVDAVKRLRLRRGMGISSSSHRSRSSTELSMMTQSDRLYHNNEIEPVVFDDRAVGVLGKAQHHGRLMSFQ